MDTGNTKGRKELGVIFSGAFDAVVPLMILIVVVLL